LSVGKWEVVAVRRTSKIIALLAATLVALAFGVGLADARAGKFLSSTAGGLTTTTTTSATQLAASSSTVGTYSPTVFLTATFTEVGLGSGKSISYALSFTDLQVDLLCVNNGNNQPQGTPLSTTTSGQTTSQQLTASSKGNIDGKLSWNLVEIAATANHFSCPNGQTVNATRVLVNPSASIVDQTNNSSSVLSASYPLAWPPAA
jgi:hypothetical protein